VRLYKVVNDSTSCEKLKKDIFKVRWPIPVGVVHASSSTTLPIYRFTPLPNRPTQNEEYKQSFLGLIEKYGGVNERDGGIVPPPGLGFGTSFPILNGCVFRCAGSFVTVTTRPRITDIRVLQSPNKETARSFHYSSGTARKGVVFLSRPSRTHVAFVFLEQVRCLRR
jgi:hypothetical protein